MGDESRFEGVVIATRRGAWFTVALYVVPVVLALVALAFSVVAAVVAISVGFGCWMVQGRWLSDSRFTLPTIKRRKAEATSDVGYVAAGLRPVWRGLRPSPPMPLIASIRLLLRR